jgi:hypothetical protein
MSILRCALFTTFALAAAGALAQSVPQPAGGSYVIQKQAIAGGGQRASGGTYVLVGTVAQATAGPLPAEATGGSYRLAGGFHTAAGLPRGNEIFRNGFEN